MEAKTFEALEHQLQQQVLGLSPQLLRWSRQWLKQQGPGELHSLEACLASEAFQASEAFEAFLAFEACLAFEESLACLESEAFQVEHSHAVAWHPAEPASAESGFGMPSAAAAAIQGETGFLPLQQLLLLPLRQLLAEEHCGEHRDDRWGRSAAAGTRNEGSCGGRCGCREAF